MPKLTTGTIEPRKLFSYLIGCIAPRPIAFASTINMEGTPNLAPFSFFNVFGSNPPTLVFSPSRRGINNTTKDTFNNIKEIAEVVINVVDYSMVTQVSLASNEFNADVNEFLKAGFTPIESDLIKPFRVKESPAQFECKVKQIIETGTEGGAGNLIICEILKAHVSDSILDDEGNIDPHKADLVGRMGNDYYCRASGDAIFTVEKPNASTAIGIDRLPEYIRNSKTLTGNDLGLLGNLSLLPNTEEIKTARSNPKYLSITESSSNKNKEDIRMVVHRLAQEYINQGEIKLALAFCME